MADAALHSVDLARASAHTIERRAHRMRSALGDPVAMADPEFSLMVREKVEAFAAASGAVAGGLQALQGILVASAIGQTLAATQAMTAMAFCGSPFAAMEIQQRWLRSAQKEAAASTSRFVTVAAGLFGVGLAPISKVASANARRLGRRT